MAGIGEKGCARAHAGEVTTFAFHAQVFLYITLRSYQTHQRFRLMGVQLIRDKDPGGVRISLEGLDDVSGKVGFGARGSNLGAMICPVATSKLAIRLWVPCRWYSNSSRST
jgi:hypothetical protein